MFIHECWQITFNKKDQDVVTFIFKGKDGGKPKGYIYIIEKDQLKAAVENIQGNLRRLKGEKVGQEDGDGTRTGKPEAGAEGMASSAGAGEGDTNDKNGGEDAKQKAALEAPAQQEGQKPAHRSAQDSSKAAESTQHGQKPIVQHSGAVNSNSNQEEPVQTSKHQEDSAQSGKTRDDHDCGDDDWLGESPSPRPADKSSQAESAATQNVGSSEGASNTQQGLSEEKGHDGTKNTKQSGGVGDTKASVSEAAPAKQDETAKAEANIVFNEDAAKSLMDDDDLDWLADVPADTGG
jgi:hypothetical protein